MNDLDKSKIAYTLALLAALFSLHPIIKDLDWGIYLFDYELKIYSCYWIISGLLAISVYSFCLLLTGIPIIEKYGKKIGDWFYIFAMLFPIIIICLYCNQLIFLAVKYILLYIIPLEKLNILVIFQVLISGVILVTTFIVSKNMKRIMASKEKILQEESERKKEMTLLLQSKDLENLGMFDLAILEIWKAIEYSLVRYLKMKDIITDRKSPTQILNSLKQNKMVDNELVNKLEDVFQLRNKAVHKIDVMTKSDVEKTLKVVEELYSYLDNRKEECYFCNKKFPVDLIETDFVTGASVCKECVIKNPNWKDELMASGMDS